LATIARWRDDRCPKIVMVAVCGVAVLGIVAMHLFAAKSYGRWPAALALFVMISMLFVRRFVFGSNLTFLKSFFNGD